MMRCIIRPFFSKCGSVNFKSKFLLKSEHAVFKEKNIFNALSDKYSTYKDVNRIETFSRKAVLINTATAGFLSGCCFSKSSDNDIIAESTQNLLVEEEKESNNENLAFVDNEIAECINSDNVNNEELSFDKQSNDNINNCSDFSLLNVEINDEIGAISDVGKRKRKRNARAMSSNSGEKLGTDDNEAFTKKKKIKEPKVLKKIPNYFIAFQISNPEILKTLMEVQKHIIENDERLKSALVSIPKSHITLMVMYLQDKDEHSKALEVLKTIHKELNVMMSESPLKLQFKGIGHFRNQVIFAKLEENDEFTRLKEYAERIRNHFENSGILSTDKPSRSFNPHLTILKLSKNPRLYRKGLKKINPDIYDNYKDHFFGNHIVNGIQLLKMSGVTDKGYYVGDEILFDIQNCE